MAFGPGVWAAASLDLKDGAKLRLDPIASPLGNILGISTGIAKARREFTDLSGERYDGWLIEAPGNMSSSRMVQIYVVDRPPYLLARFSRDLDSGEESKGTRLKRFQFLQ